MKEQSCFCHKFIKDDKNKKMLKKYWTSSVIDGKIVADMM